MLLVTYQDDSQDQDTLPMERRRGLRIAQNRSVKVYEPSASRFLAGKTRNISSTGLQLEFPGFVQLSPGRIVNIHIGIDDRGYALANRRNMVMARVVWVKPETVMKTEIVLAGVEYLTDTTAGLGAA